MTHLAEGIRQSAEKRRGRIFLIPDDCKIDKQYLGELSNSEFIAAFRTLQQLLINVYEDVETNPLEWGYGAPNNISDPDAGPYDRILWFFSAIGSNSVISGDELLIEKLGFKRAFNKKVPAIIDRMKNLGLIIEGYKSKAETFIVTFPDHPDALKTWHYFAKAQTPGIGWGCAIFTNLSHRRVEDPTEQNHPPLFLAKMDISSKEAQEIQYWLYDEAPKYGYTLAGIEQYCFNYKKGSKNFILVGEDINKSLRNKAYARVMFRNIFESHPEKVSSLAKKIPGVFGKSTCGRCGWGGSDPKAGDNHKCRFKIPYNFEGEYYESCSYHSFYFHDINLDIFKEIFELFLLEKKIKKINSTP